MDYLVLRLGLYKLLFESIAGNISQIILFVHDFLAKPLNKLYIQDYEF